MKSRILLAMALGAAAALCGGCASISTQSNAFLGSPHYPPTTAASVKILMEEPKQPMERLGQVFLSVEGQPKREDLERRLREEAARLGANAVFVVSDKLHVFPYVYWDPWWGPSGNFEETRRDIVGIAVRLK